MPFHGKMGEEKQAAPQGTQARVMRTQPIQEQIEFVGFGDRNCEFFQPSDTSQQLAGSGRDLIMKRPACVGEFQGGLIVGFGFAQPLARRPFHKGFSPW